MQQEIGGIKDYSKSIERFFSDKPTLIGVSLGWRFYEHPKYGDETGLVAYRKATNELYLTDFYDVPTLEELL